MATAEERALVKLGSELDKLGRQIQRLLEKQAELTQEKTRLEAARDAAYSAVSTPSSRRLSATAILTRAPGWERQRGRGRQPASSPLPQPDFSSANPFEVLSSRRSCPGRGQAASLGAEAARRLRHRRPSRGGCRHLRPAQRDPEGALPLASGHRAEEDVGQACCLRSASNVPARVRVIQSSFLSPQLAPGHL
ncbi:uncharacterized protein LOC143487904 [Brachyhypopomus gauderio]|uniref:uncharacterized protein LOC143487904 n=1 Tax=Brachyhypopomus gauderio TaxID=698409 RepID=UPI0040432780